MTNTLLNKENFPTSANNKNLAEKVSAKATEKLTRNPCVDAIFCEQALFCDGKHCPTLHSER